MQKDNNKDNSQLVMRAEQFARFAHGRIHQKRKYSGEDYINHPARVVQIVKTVDHSQEMLAAAWLHDVVEDTGVAIESIKDEFGAEVAILVAMVTNVSRQKDGNRAIRKAIDSMHLSNANRDAKIIKLADIIDNCSNIAQEADADFAKLYLEEKSHLLHVLQDGDDVLRYRARDVIQQNQLFLS